MDRQPPAHGKLDLRLQPDPAGRQTTPHPTRGAVAFVSIGRAASRSLPAPQSQRGHVGAAALRPFSRLDWDSASSCLLALCRAAGPLAQCPATASPARLIGFPLHPRRAGHGLGWAALARPSTVGLAVNRPRILTS